MSKETILVLLAFLGAFPAHAASRLAPWKTENCGIETHGKPWYEPVLTQPLDPGHRLIVCSLYYDEGSKPKAGASAVDVHAVRIFLIGRTEAELLSFRITRDRSSGIGIASLLWLPVPGKDSGALQPFTESRLSCDKSLNCTLSGKRCVLDLPRNPFPRAREELKARGQAKGPDGRPDIGDDLLAARVFAQALSGDREALKDFKAIQDHFSMDGASAEGFEALWAAMQEAEKLGCLPAPGSAH